MDYLDISINHLEIVCRFIKILLEYKRDSSTKTFLSRNIQIWLRSVFGSQKKFKIRVRSRFKKNSRISDMNLHHAQLCFIFLELIIHIRAALNSWLRGFLFSCLCHLRIFKVWRRALLVAMPKRSKPKQLSKSLLLLLSRLDFCEGDHGLILAGI